MSYLASTYEVVSQRYPEAVAEVMAGLRKSRSKSKNDAAETLEWGFEWGVRVPIVSLAEEFRRIGSGESQADRAAREARTEDQKVQDYAKLCLVSLVARKEKRRLASAKIEVPQEILEEHRESLQEDEREKARFAAMSPEERQKDLDEALRTLQKGGGFQVFQIEVPKP